MDEGSLLYVLLLIAYGLYSFFTGGKKENQQNMPLPPIFEMDGHAREIEPPQAQPQTPAAPAPAPKKIVKPQKVKTIHEPVFTYDTQPIKRENIDNDSPKTHKADNNYRKKRKRFSLGKNFKFNLHDAIIYKEILTKKY